MMNALAKGVLTLYSYDDNADNTSIENVVRQSLQLIAQFPQLAVYSYRDVYQRQGKHCRTCAQAFLTNSHKTVEARALLPVSYTHLDVYKRQA